MGRFDDALKVFEQLDQHGALQGSKSVDQWALNGLVNVYAAAGRMDEAEVAARRASAFASDRGLRVPHEAYGALVKGYCSQRDVAKVLDVFRRFLAAGGRPRTRMINAVVRVCLMRGETRSAAQAVRAMELLGIPVNRELYKQWNQRYKEVESRRLERAQGDGRRAGDSEGGSSGGGGGSGGRTNREAPRVLNGSPQPIERVKWWFGLPNTYYNSPGP